MFFFWDKILTKQKFLEQLYKTQFWLDACLKLWNDGCFVSDQWQYAKFTMAR